MKELEKYKYCLECLCNAIKYDIQEVLKKAEKNPHDDIVFGQKLAYSTFYSILTEQTESLDIPLEKLFMDEFKESDFF